MTPEQILSQPPRVLTQAQRESYFEHGCLLLERLIPAGPIADVNADLVGPDIVFHHSKLNFKWHDPRGWG